jgi:hypothetical protein
MHNRPDSRSIRTLGALRWVLAAGLMLAMLLTPPLLKSQTMHTNSTSYSRVMTTRQELIQHVPEQVGKYIIETHAITVATSELKALA